MDRTAAGPVFTFFNMNVALVKERGKWLIDRIYFAQRP